MSNSSVLVVIGNVTEENCKLALKLNRSPLLMSVAFLHVVVAIFGYFAQYKYFKTKSIQKAVGLVSWNLKIICMSGFIYYFWCLTHGLMIYGYKLYLYIRHLEACDYIWNGDSCYITFISSFTCSVASALFHGALLVERCYAIFFCRSHEGAPVFGILVGLFLLVFPNYLSFGVEYSALRELGILKDRVYCSGPVPNIQGDNLGTILSYVYFLAFDVFVSVLDFCLLLYNKRKVAKYYQSISDYYTLNRSFSLKEIQLSIRLIFPFSLVHSVLFAEITLCYFYYLLYAKTSNVEMDQFWRECINLARTLNNVILFTTLCFFHRKHETPQVEEKRIENEADHYFKMFNQMVS